ISSMNSSVPLPVSRRLLARSNALRRSCTPEKMAESCSKARRVSSASRRAMVVLPDPGGPHRIMLCSRLPASMRVSVPSRSRPAASKRLLTSLTRDLQLHHLIAAPDGDLPQPLALLEQNFQLAHRADPAA